MIEFAGATSARCAGAANALVRVTVRLGDRGTRIRRLSETLEVPVPALWTGVWALLLQRYLGEDEVVVTTADADRRVAQSVVAVSDALPSADWLARAALGSLARAQRERAAPALRDPGVWSDVVLHVEPGSVSVGSGAPAEIWLERDLSAFAFTFDPGRLAGDAVERAAGHLSTLLDGILANPRARVADLPLLTASERHQLLVEWNATAVPHRPGCAHERFADGAAVAPAGVAVSLEGRELTYRELDERANQLAQYLRRVGVGPDVLVGVCLERSLELVITLLAVLKAGGAYVPLDPAYPAERLAFMLADADLSVLVTRREHLARMSAGRARAVCVPEVMETIRSEPAAPVASGVRPHHLAYVMYTSGSTGRPKGVAVSHASLVNHIDWILRAFPLTAGDRVLQRTPFSFDSSLIEFWAPLFSGARLVLARPGSHGDPAYLTRVIAAEGITFVLLVPSLLSAVLDVPAFDVCRSLRVVISAGETLTAELRDRFFARSRALLSNHYGPTETAIGATYWNCDRERREATVPIGRPVDNVRLYVLDRRMRPLPVGVPGELYIGGAGVARGYLNRPEVTAERFVDDPFEPGARLYRTGDLVRYRPDGALEFLGRVDHQVKVRGIRVEPGEIEDALTRHPGVRQAVIVARSNGRGEARLVAYLVPGPDFPGAKEVRRWLMAQLPEHLVPARFVELERLPVLPNGKVDRRALPEPGSHRPALGHPYAPPRSALERYLADLWTEVLGLDQVGIHDRFFELGGDSIQAAIVLNRLQCELRAPVFIVSVFEAPTIAEYAAWLEREYPAEVGHRVGASRRVAPPPRAARPIDSAAVAALRARWPLLETAASPARNGVRNPRVVFILAPPRSGTTLLRAMLGGHPDLFAADELHLLGFRTMADRRTALSGAMSLWLDGAVRAVMELRRCGPEEAKAVIASYEAPGRDTLEFYRLLQEWISPRVLVDKTPAYAMDLVALRRAEQEFRDPLYVHLVRHPHAMVRSFERRRLDQVFPGRDGWSPRELGELVWLTSHENTLAFLQDVPANRQCRIRFEDLIRHPERVMRALCSAVGLRFDPALVHPYNGTERNATTGVYAVSTSMADPSFGERRSIDPTVADRWRGVVEDDFLGDLTWGLAAAFGYERSSSSPARRAERLQRQRDRRNGGQSGASA